MTTSSSTFKSVAQDQMSKLLDPKSSKWGGGLSHFWKQTFVNFPFPVEKDRFRARSTRHARGPRSSGHFEKSRISQTNKERQIRDLKQASSFDFWCNDSRWTLNLLPPLFFVSHIGDHCHGKPDRWSGFWAENFDQKMIKILNKSTCQLMFLQVKVRVIPPTPPKQKR